MIIFHRSTYKSDRQDCPCVQRLNSKNFNDERVADEEAAVAEVGETKANEVAGEKTSFCPESLAGCSPFAKFLPFLSRSHIALFYNTTVSISNLLLVELCTSRFTALNFSAPTRVGVTRKEKCNVVIFMIYGSRQNRGLKIKSRKKGTLSFVLSTSLSLPSPPTARHPPARPPFTETNHPQVFSPGAPPANGITAVRCPARSGVRMHGPTHTGQNIRECPTRNAIAKPFYDTDSFLLLRQNKGLTLPPSLHPFLCTLPPPQCASTAINKSMRATETGVVSAGSRRTSRDARRRITKDERERKRMKRVRQDETAAKEEAARVGGRWRRQRRRRQRRRWRYRGSAAVAVVAGGGGVCRAVVRGKKGAALLKMSSLKSIAYIASNRKRDIGFMTRIYDLANRAAELRSSEQRMRRRRGVKNDPDWGGQEVTTWTLVRSTGQTGSR
ncbi:hypothetical protein ALC62_10609 [Cyphomyrmex costatus]|uniref:Uncharacterized protein n=1 Tax=Cyphomyrmex costatus TaxID=456900 RepID=A0A195CEJ2_9HYME|nr:hypothetical protein ALC62_10609 [Cyphomyrmex costatus]